MVITQRCPRCSKDLPPDDYHPDKQGKTGNYCRTCVVEYKREWRRAHGQVPQAERFEATRRRCAQPGCDESPSSRNARHCTGHRPVRVPSTDYHVVHRRVAKARGRAATHACAHCPAQAEQWAYDHADPAEVTGRTARGVAVVYSLDPSHYLPLCQSCHVRMDNNSKDRYEGSQLQVLNNARRAAAMKSAQPKQVSSW